MRESFGSKRGGETPTTAPDGNRRAARNTTKMIVVDSRRWLARVGVALLGSLASLAFPVAGWWWLGWFGLAPLIALIATAPTPREALLRSWMAGAAFMTALHSWLIPNTGLFTIPLAAFVGLFWLPLGLAVYGSLRPGVPAVRRWAGVVVVPAVWVVIEWARSWEYLGGTWGLWGLTQWRQETIIQAAALGGVWLLGFLLVMANTAIAAGIFATGWQRATALGLALLVPLVMVIGGAMRSGPPVTGSVRIAGVQAGVFDDAHDRLAAHVALTATLQPATFDAVVWGQSSVALDPGTDPEVDATIRAAAETAGTDLFVNVDADVGDGISKSTRQYTPDGSVASYSKRRLVPFGEYIPLRSLLGWLDDVTEAADTDRIRGDSPSVMTSAGVDIGPLISYESTFPDLRRELARLGVDVTVVQGSSWTFQGTAAQPQQASFEAVRAVESGRPAMLVATSGTSAAFDARGRQLAWIPPDVTEAFVVEIPLGKVTTPYVRWGNWVVWMSLVLSLAAAWSGMRRGRSTRGLRADR